jgi:hypothetical protein
MELFTRLFDDLLTLVYHCFDPIVIHGYLSGLSRPEQVVYFFREVLGMPCASSKLRNSITKSIPGPVPRQNSIPAGDRVCSPYENRSSKPELSGKSGGDVLWSLPKQLLPRR